MGLTGAPAQVLMPDEWRSEVEWAIRNPWGSGSADMGLGESPLVLVSQYSRPTDTAMTRSTPVAIAQHARAANFDVLAVAGEGGSRALPAIDADEFGGDRSGTVSRRVTRVIRRVLKLAEGDPAVAVILRPDSGSGTEFMSAVLDAIASLCTRDHLSTAPLPRPDRWSTRQDITYDATHAPNALAQETASAIRKRRMSRADKRAVLESSVWPAFRAHRQARSPVTRDFVASMMGEIMLSGPHFDAGFTAGRLTHVRTADGPIFECGPLRAFVVTPETVYDMEPAGCFSFESAQARGIRAVERLYAESAGMAAECVTDYSFVDDRPALIMCSAFALEVTSGPLTPILVRGTDHPVADVGLKSKHCLAGDTQCEAAVHGFSLSTRSTDLVVGLFSRLGKPIVGLPYAFGSGTGRMSGIAFTAMTTTGRRYQAQYVAALAPGSFDDLGALFGARPNPAVLREITDGPNAEEIRLDFLAGPLE